MNPESVRKIRRTIRVAALIFVRGKILLAKHKRRGKPYWVLPGGKVEKGETLADCATRELFEEASIKIKTGDIAFVNEVISPDMSVDIINIYFAVSSFKGRVSVQTGKRLKGMRLFSKKDFKKVSLWPAVKEEVLKIWKGESQKPLYVGNKFALQGKP